MKDKDLLIALASWTKVKSVLDITKKEEMDLRLLICEELLKNKSTGVHKFDFGPFKIKAVKKNTTSIIEE
jgi:hypothetical protein